MKILNLYSGIGGNRKLWGDQHKITAVEYKPEIAQVYKDLFPNDNLIIGDAHQYLLDHYKEFDFIWASPPCPSHSRLVQSNKNKENYDLRYPEMSLYQEIILLQTMFKGKYVVENVVAYYEPLIKPIELQRHHFWTNFNIGKISLSADNIEKGNIQEWQERLGYDLSMYKGLNKRLVLRNCVRPELGLHILQEAGVKTEQPIVIKQESLL